MKITTGLRPDVQRFTFPGKPPEAFVYTFRDGGDVVLGPLGVEAFVTRFLRVKDDPTGRAGETVSIHVGPREPTIKRVSRRYGFADETPNIPERWAELMHRSGAPADTLVHDEPDPMHNAFERVGEWYEVEL